MRLLIIGSKGFIGNVCYDYFKKQTGLEVYGADVVVDYNDPNYFLIDGTNADFKSIFKAYSFDWCMNCAGAASVPASFENPARDYLLNVFNLVQLLNAIKEENNYCKLIQLSSAAVYGNPLTLPVSEDHPLSPLSPYGIHKKQAEELCRLYFDYFGINSFVLRLFSAYGSGLKKQLFWDLYKKSQQENNITLFGTGKETRDFIHVLDIARAMEAMMKSGRTGCNIINVASNKAISIGDAAHIFLKEIGYKGAYDFNGINRTGDPLYWQADTTILESLGYKQKISFEQGINDYCTWLKEKE